MGVEKPLDLSIFRAPVEQDDDDLPYIAIEMAHNQDVDAINMARNKIDMFAAPTMLRRAAAQAEADLSRPLEEPRLVVQGELVIEEEEKEPAKPGAVVDLSKCGANTCAVSERPKPFVRYIWREERLVRVEAVGIRADSVPTLTRRWAHLIETQLVRPGEVPEMVVEEDENAGQPCGASVREGAGEFGGG